MQLEAGKKYTDRRGRVYGPLVKVHCDLFGEDADDYEVAYANDCHHHQQPQFPSPLPWI
jgi:hypothetical protein